MENEILLVAESVSGEKDLPKESIFEAIEQALATATKKRYKEPTNIRVSIDQKTGEYETYRLWEVVSEEDFEESSFHLLIEEAKTKDESLELGSFVSEKVENVAFGRIAAQAAKQVIVQKVREAERAKIVDKYRPYLGEMVSGSVKKVTREFLIVDLGDGAEAVLSRNELIPGEVYRMGDRLRAVLQEEERENRGSQLCLSRKCPEMVSELFRLEVPEISEQVIEIKAVARDAGSRSKLAVKTNDNRIDPVGACVGMRGSRVQAVVNELQGEKIDIVNWSEDPAILVANALSPAEVQRVNVDSDRKKLDVILTEENLSKAIGRRGQNVRLATKLLNYEINIMTDQEDSERRQIEFKEKTDNFVKNLELDETLGQLLVAEGYSSIDDIKDGSIENLTKIEGIEEDTAKELIERAKEFHQKDQMEINNKIKDLGLESELINHKGLTPGMLVTLGDSANQQVSQPFPENILTR